MLGFVALVAAVLATQGVRMVKKGRSVGQKRARIWSSPLEKSASVGWGGGGDEFDHWNDEGLAGAISKICVRHGYRVDAITVSFAGHEVKKGGDGGTETCWSLRADEFITTVMIRAAARVDGIQFHTSRFDGSPSRVSPMFGGSGGQLYTLRAPAGKHLMGFYGRAAWELDQLGLYWGAGGGQGAWVQLPHCRGCSSNEYEHSVCSERSTSSTHELSETWSVSVEKEMSAGIEFKGVSASQSLKITAGYSRTTVTSSTSSFSTTKCERHTFQCDLDYVWQWQLASDFDAWGTVITASPNILCTNEANPCCLPNTFSNNSNPTICDRDSSAPNLCSSR